MHVKLLVIVQLFSAWRRLGAHPGAVFQTWLNNIFSSYAVPNKQAMDRKLQLPATLKFQVGGLDLPLKPAPTPSLKLVAAELTTQSMVIFPRDAQLFYKVSCQVACRGSRSTHQQHTAIWG